MERARQRFAPGSVDYNGPIAANYRSGRSFSLHAAEAWRTAVAPFNPSRAVLYDPGSGRRLWSLLSADVNDEPPRLTHTSLG